MKEKELKIKTIRGDVIYNGFDYLPIVKTGQFLASEVHGRMGVFSVKKEKRKRIILVYLTPLLHQ